MSDLGLSPYIAKQPDNSPMLLEEVRSLAKQLLDAVDRLDWTLHRLEDTDERHPR